MLTDKEFDVLYMAKNIYGITELRKAIDPIDYHSYELVEKILKDRINQLIVFVRSMDTKKYRYCQDCNKVYDKIHTIVEHDKEDHYYCEKHFNEKYSSVMIF